MTKYCPACGRSMPEDGNMCPYCGKLVAKHEGMIVKSPQVEKKKDRSALLIAIVIIILVIVPIAIAATVYVYVSGMIGSDLSGLTDTPNFDATIETGPGNNVTLLVTYIDTDDAYWPYVIFEIEDITDGEDLTKYYDYTTNAPYSYIEKGDIIKVTGSGDEFQENHQYQMTLIYSMTYEIIGTYTWTQ